MLVCVLLVAISIPAVESIKNNAINSTVPSVYLIRVETSEPDRQKFLATGDTTETFFGHSDSHFALSEINRFMQNKTISYLTAGQNLSMLQPGDIAFKHPDIFPIILDHCLLYIGYNNSTGMYVFIEASAMNDQVKYRYENESTLIGPFYGPFAKVKHANNSQKQNAIDFAKKQLGKPFQGAWINKNYNPEDTINDSLADEWYCTELIWAAYYNCNNPFPEEEPEGGYVYGDGIDLDRNSWKKNMRNISIVRPREISRNIFEVKLFHLNNNKYIIDNTWEKMIFYIFY